MPRDDFEALGATSTTSVRDQQVAELEEALMREQDKRHEERFVAILVGIILLDIHVFTSMQNWGAPIAIVALELLLLLGLARRFGVEEIEGWVDKMLAPFWTGKERE